MDTTHPVTPQPRGADASESPFPNPPFPDSDASDMETGLDRLRDNSSARHAFVPSPPESLGDLGLTPRDARSLILKILLNSGILTGRQITEHIRLPFAIVQQQLSELKRDELVAQRLAMAMGDYEYELTDAGHEHARRHASRCTYFGAAPVSLDQYWTSVTAQASREWGITIAQVQNAYRDLVLEESTIRQLAQALASRRGLLLHGPPGNGKSSVLRRIDRVVNDVVWIPRTITVAGEMIRLYDPIYHEIIRDDELTRIASPDQYDRRWVPIRRPVISVASELRLEQLDVQFNTFTGINEAPIQLKSNCGVLIIDDFGRQPFNRIELRNRWTQPLENRYDFLTFPSGWQIKVPFELLFVLATNLEQRKVFDESLARRISYKIELSNPSEEQFRSLLRRTAEQLGIQYSEESVEYLLEKHYRSQRRSPRFCHAGDLLTQIHQLCRLTDTCPSMVPNTIDEVVLNYFGSA